MADVKKIPTRSEVAEEDTWAIHDLFETDEAWEEEFVALKELSKQAPAYAGRLGESAATLLEYLNLVEKTSGILTEMFNYAERSSDVDTRVAKYQDMCGRMMAFFVELRANTAFETPELLSIDEKKLEDFYREEPGLEKFRRYLNDTLRKKAHVLSPAEEKLLAAAGDMTQAPETIYSMFNDADLTFPDAVDSEGQKHPLSQGTYISYLESSDRVLRKSAFENLYHMYAGYRNTVAAVQAAEVKQRQFVAQARKYSSSLECALDATNVPVNVYTNLIEAVHQNMDKMYRYVALRKKLLGVDELHMYDLYTPLVSGVDKKIPFAQAKETVYDALAPMGDYYRSILREGFDNRWIDVYENEGKRTGAYSAGARKHPYVLLNYSGTLDSQFTLAHEMGHAIHSYLSNKNQPIIDADYVIFVAEVASTCNEALLMEHLLGKTTDKKERAYLINHFLEQFRGTLYRQTMFAEFEMILGKLAQEGQTLTADLLNEEYRKLNRLYFGDDIVLDSEIDSEWMRIPHFYYNYYVFQYATGYSAAIALSRRILKEGKPAVDDYLKFLSGGCSKSPIELLKIAGVDMSTPEPVNDALQLFGELLDEMEALTNDIDNA